MRDESIEYEASEDKILGTARVIPTGKEGRFVVVALRSHRGETKVAIASAFAKAGEGKHEAWTVTEAGKSTFGTPKAGAIVVAGPIGRLEPQLALVVYRAALEIAEGVKASKTSKKEELDEEIPAEKPAKKKRAAK